MWDDLPDEIVKKIMAQRFELMGEGKWQQYDPNRVKALWYNFRPIARESVYDLVLMPFEA